MQFNKTSEFKNYEKGWKTTNYKRYSYFSYNLAKYNTNFLLNLQDPVKICIG